LFAATVLTHPFRWLATQKHREHVRDTTDAVRVCAAPLLAGSNLT